jgi:hypothetical protein
MLARMRMCWWKKKMMKKEQFLSYINSGVQEDVLCAYFLCSKQAKNTIYINLYLFVCW